MSKQKRMERFFCAYAVFSTEGEETQDKNLKKFRKMIEETFGNEENYNLLSHDAGRCLHAENQKHALQLAAKKLGSEAHEFRHNRIVERLSN